MANHNLFVFCCCGILGALFFMLVFGTRVLDFKYIDWLIDGEDLTQHYLGWGFFRNSEWSFPIGLVDSFIYPYKESIMFSDSIPLFAIFFKVISFMLPGTFQYFGLFGILAFILQGGFGGLIIKKLTNNTALSIVASLFFTTVSFMTLRMYSHTALAAHFIILASIYVCISKDKSKGIFYNSMAWGGLLSLAASIHLYFVPMVFVFMALYFLDDLFVYKKVIKTIAEAGVSILLLGITMFLLGAFYSDTPKPAGGLRIYSANLNVIVNSCGLSEIFKHLPFATRGQYEGNAWMGYGMLILVFIALFSIVENFKSCLTKLSDQRVTRRAIFCVIAFVTFYAVALSPLVTLNDKILFEYRLPGRIEAIWSIFRATGRFIWPSIYIVMILAIYIAVKWRGKAVSIIMISVLLFVQCQDMAGWLRFKGANFRSAQAYETNLRTDVWRVIASEYKHLFYTGNIDNMYPVAKFAVENGLTLNDTYLARKDSGAIESYKRETLRRLNLGIAEDDTVYFFSIVPAAVLLNETLFVYEFDEMMAGFSRSMENRADMQGVRRINPGDGVDVMPPNGINMRNAVDEEGGRVLDTDGATWTIYYDLSPGMYTYEWHGENFQNATFDMAYGDGSATLAMMNADRTGASYRFEVLVVDGVSNLHARCFNPSEESVRIESVRLWKNRETQEGAIQ